MKLTLVTPTLGRPDSFAFLERCVAVQTLQPFEWIVCNDGPAYDYRLGQRVIARGHHGGEWHSLCENLYHGLAAVSEQVDGVAVMCDDDWYSPFYLKRVADGLSQAEAVRVGPCYFYNLRNRSVMNFKRPYPDLSTLSFRRGVVPWAQSVCARGNPHIDRCFWKNFTGTIADVENEWMQLCLKGLEGFTPVDPAHHACRGADDPHGEALRAFVGEETAAILDKRMGFA